MKKKRIMLICCFVIIVALLVASIAFIVTLNSLTVSKPLSFDLSEYSENLELYALSPCINPSVKYGEINSVEAALAAGKDVIKEVYRDTVLGKSWPYLVSYYKENNAWLIQATMLMSIGGGAHVILDGGDGAILAVWNYKF